MVVECSLPYSCELDRSQFDSQLNNEEREAVIDVSPSATVGTPYEKDCDISKLAPISELSDAPNVYDSEILSVLVSESSMELIMG